MEVLAVPRIILSGVKAGVGKSILSMGIAMELRRRSIAVSACVLGLDLSQSIILKRVCGRYVRSLDQRLLSREQILSSLFLAGIGADVVLIDGEKGLFDGVPSGGFYRGSDSEFAALTRTPVCLVFDARGFGSSIGALVKGYASTASGFELVGTIANRISRDTAQNQEQKETFSEALKACSAPGLLGATQEFQSSFEVSRKQINQMKNETLLPRQFFVDVADLVREHVDVEKIVTLAQRALGVRLENFTHQPRGRLCRIAVSDDSAFNLCLQDNLELLRYYGAEIVPFSPLADRNLPQRIGGVYLTGGYIPEYVEQLSSNESIRNALREFADRGGVVYAEGSGAAWLCDRFKVPDNEVVYDGLGILSGTAVPGSGVWSVNEGVTIEESILGRQGMVIKSISTGDWTLDKAGAGVRVLRFVERGGKSYTEGFSPRAQVVATFHFQHWGSNPEVAKNMVDAAAVVHNLTAT